MNDLTKNYFRSTQGRLILLFLAMVLLPIVLCVSITVGAAAVPLRDTIAVFLGWETEERFVRIIMNIRLPQTLAAILAGAGLAISGATMQSVLRNPLCSPFTLGISSAAAFGAALTLLFGGGKIVSQDNTLIHPGMPQSMISLGAFFACLITSAVILALARLRGSRSETIILLGVAFSSLFSAGLMFLQYFADESRLAAIVYWTFGDTARATWNMILLLSVCIVPVSAYFLSQSWNYNALIFGEETALGLGVPVRRVRILTMILSSLLTALLVSVLGIIGFVGLVIPHLARLCVGSDHRFLLPFSLVSGALLLLTADLFARLILAPRILPVSILTAFIGVPVFLSLLLGKRGI
ncbi:MAG: iron ABC transporter permease [Planctomycetaceae bacterium]|jgi:iron complex transport system permease protein|nr:iron ABC transporter permease [Planctomycetaceae bacterium]